MAFIKRLFFQTQSAEVSVKLKSLFIASLLMLATNAFAQWFIRPEIYVTPLVTVARIHNVWGRPVFCQGEVFGLTRQGFWPRAAMADVIPMGQFREAVVFTNSFDPFVPGYSRSNLWCNFL
jgi:hypothetical protein